MGCTGLTTIESPNSVTEIGYKAFMGCTGLKNFRTHKENPDDTKKYFDGLDKAFLVYSELKFSDITFFVPVGTGYAYRDHEFFKNFKEIIATSKSLFND